MKCPRWLGASAVVAATMLVMTPAGFAQSSNPLAPGLPQQPGSTSSGTPTTPVVATPTTSTSGGSGLSGTDGVAIGVGAVVVLAGISTFIWRDARRRAPVRERSIAAEAGVGGRSGSKARAKPRKLSPAERRRRKRGRARR